MKIRRRSPLIAAFSLIELLVVISIIALLIGILLPVLSSARSVARDAVCTANLKQIGTGLANYTASNGNYFPGPNTSGDSFAANRSPDQPTMKGDWYSPMFGNELALPSNRNDRLIDIFGNHFRCPNNDRVYDYIYPSGNGWPGAETIPYNSYSMPSGFSYYYDQAHATAHGQSRGRHFGNSHDQAVDTRLARNVFKDTTIGPPSTKVFVLDGARYLDSSGRISFNTDGGTDFGDNFSTRGPVLNALYADNGNPYKATRRGGQIVATQDAREITYRHGGNTAVNVVYFDGHSELLSDADTRDVDKFFPSGSVVRNPSSLADPNVRNRQVIR